MRVQSAAEPITNPPEDPNAVRIYVMGRLASGQMRTGKSARPWWMEQGLINSR